MFTPCRGMRQALFGGLTRMYDDCIRDGQAQTVNPLLRRLAKGLVTFKMCSICYSNCAQVLPEFVGKTICGKLTKAFRCAAHKSSK